MAHQSSSSSITYKWRYDVFLSFYGDDTRHGFVSHLYESLHRSGIHAFIDYKIRNGEHITAALFKAIEESRIAIIVFSENYAKSTFCLLELEKVVDCFKEKSRLIYPVFYHVDPSELRRPKGSYAQALKLQEERFKDNRHKVEKWRQVLSQVADLKGYHLIPKIANEQECITWITSDVAARINLKPLHVTNSPVGLESRVKEVISCLDLWSTKEIKMIGIWGAGGIGKSTIARAVYNSIADNFEGVCFLFEVRKHSEMPTGLSHLQEKLLGRLVMEKDLKLDDYHEGIPIIEHRLSQRKILLILDDVDESNQLKALAGSCDWFGHGSRIIITTRNKQLLESHGIESIYDVKELNGWESLKLLTWYAFKKENVDSNYMEVCKRAMHYCCGFPLVLEVIGSHLYDKEVSQWNSALEQFKSIPDRTVLNALKLSFDMLEEVEKQVFLDLACFFNGKKSTHVNDMLQCIHGIQSEYAIGNLVDKSLIKIVQDCITMHDLIEDLGKDIVRQESSYEPGERSRLWFSKDILHVLQEDTGTNKVEAIILDLPKSIEVQWSGEELLKMKNLKMLVVRNACFSGSPKYLPNSLRWFEWKGYAFNFFPVCPTQLVYLDLSYSSCEFLQTSNKKFPNLSRMNLRNCKFLQQILDLSGASNLKELWLDGCTNLIEIHDSVGCLNNMRVLSAIGCKNLKIFPSRLSLTSLEHLNLRGCSSLQTFPEISRASNLIELWLDDCTNLIGIHDSVGCLNKLRKLSAIGCNNLRIFPSRLSLTSLEHLNLRGCSSLQTFPEISGASNLKELWLDGCTNLIEIHDSVGCLNKLRELSAVRCKNLRIFPSRLILTSLEHLNLYGCSSLQTFPEISRASNLTELCLSNCTNLIEVHDSVGCLNKLIKLGVVGCKNLKIFPSRLIWTSLERLNLYGCSSLQTFPEISRASNLIELWLDDCTNLIEIHDSVGCLNKLRELSVVRCKNLKIFPYRLSSTSLVHLNLCGCSSLQTFPEIPIVMKEMRTLRLDKTAITELPSSICNLIGLIRLSLEKCPNLKQLPASICTLPNLLELTTNYCERLSHFKKGEGGDEASLYWSAMSSKMKWLWFSNCNLSDDSLAFCLSHFVNVMHLDLSFNNFTILPECIKECHNLEYLLLNHCFQLEHIEGMPLNLGEFSAICCTSLTKSSKRNVFKKVSNIQPRKRNFILPGKELPKGLHHYNQGSSVSFWVRNVFPMASLWILFKDHRPDVFNYKFSVRINGTNVDSMRRLLSIIKTDHIYICDMQSIILSTELPFVNKWNQVEISFESEAKEIYFGVHVYNLQSNVENIQFMDPRKYIIVANLLQKIKDVEEDMNLDSNSTKYVGSLDNPMYYQERDIMEKLRPYWDLEIFKVDGHSYNNLIELHQIKCKNWRIPALGQLPALRTLTIEGLESVVAIGSEFFHGHDSASLVPFPSLETLHFENMISWEEWNSIDVDAFPNLHTLRFHDCPKLIGNLPRPLLSLMNLEIERCPLLASSIPNYSCLDKLVIIKSPNVVFQEQELPLFLSHLTVSGTQMSVPLFERMYVEHLIIRDCPDAVPLPAIHMPHSVKRLTIVYCENLKFLRSLFDDMKRLLPILKELFIKGRPELEPFSLTLPSSLERLEIRECDKFLSWLTELHHLPTITQLCIYFPSVTWHCKSPRHLTSQELQIEGQIMPPSLQRLHICDDGFLLEQCGEDIQVTRKLSRSLCLRRRYG
ncbi:hypothetical protein K1719_002001 [Acacia pycnantha]|nr:hypothetical protein K1719_002001 [Acacia pycnantha]